MVRGERAAREARLSKQRETLLLGESPFLGDNLYIIVGIEGILGIL